MFSFSFPSPILMLRLLVLAVALQAGATKTVHVPDNDNLVVAVPNTEAAAGQEPVVRVVARDLDKVNVVSFTPEDNLSRRSGGNLRPSVEENRYVSMEAINADSPPKHSHHDHSHRRHHESHTGEGDPNMLETPHMTFIGPQGVVSSMPSALGQGVSPGPKTGMPTRRALTMQKRSNSVGPSHMSKSACREALNSVGHCEALLRRAMMCEKQGFGNKRRRSVSVSKKHTKSCTINRHSHDHGSAGKSRSTHSRASDLHHYSKPRRFDHHNRAGARRVHHR